MTKKELFSFVLFGGLLFVGSILSENAYKFSYEDNKVNVVTEPKKIKRDRRMPKYHKCKRAYPDKDDIDDFNACSWMFGPNEQVLKDISMK